MHPIAIAILLAASPEAGPAPKVVATDLLGDPLPTGAIARLGTNRYRLMGWQQQAFFSADGKFVLATGEQGQIKYMEADTGKVFAEIKDPDIFNWSADVSPDGSRIVVFGFTHSTPGPKLSLRVYDVATRKVIWTSPLEGSDRADHARVRFTPDGKRLVAERAMRQA